MSLNLQIPSTGGHGNAITLNGATIVQPYIYSDDGKVVENIQVMAVNKDGMGLTELLPYGTYVYDKPEIYLIKPINFTYLGRYSFTIQTAPTQAVVYVSKLSSTEYLEFEKGWFDFYLLQEKIIIDGIQTKEDGSAVIESYTVNSSSEYLIFWFKTSIEAVFQSPFLKVNSTYLEETEVGTYQVVSVPVYRNDSYNSSSVTIKGKVEDTSSSQDSNILAYHFGTLSLVPPGKPSIINDTNIEINQLSLTQEGNFKKAEIAFPFDIYAGQTYDIKIGETLYSNITAQVKDFYVFLGSDYLSDQNTEEYPFCIYNTISVQNPEGGSTNPGDNVVVSNNNSVVLLASDQSTVDLKIASNAKDLEETQKTLPNMVKQAIGSGTYVELSDGYFSYTANCPLNQIAEIFLHLNSKTASIQIESIQYNYSLNLVCLAGETLITLADGSQKQLCEIQVGDQVLSQNGVIARVEKVNTNAMSDYHTLYTFENGTVIDETGPHAFYNVEKNCFLNLSSWEIGYHALDERNNPVSLVSKERVDEPKQRFGIWTSTKMYYANGLLSAEHTKNLELLEEVEIDEMIEMINSINSDIMMEFISY